MEPKQKESLLALFQSTSSSLRETDPEWVKIVADFSLEELSAANGLTERERMICILSVLLGCQGMGEYRHMLHAGLGSNRHQRNPLSKPQLIWGLGVSTTFWKQPIRLWNSMALQYLFCPRELRTRLPALQRD